MNKEDIKELQEYNLKYLEARNNEEIFGGDYTSEVELEYVKKENQRLQKELDKYKNIVDELERYIKTNYDYYTEVNDVNLAKKYVYKDLLDKIKNLLKGE